MRLFGRESSGLDGPEWVRIVRDIATGCRTHGSAHVLVKTLVGLRSRLCWAGVRLGSLLCWADVRADSFITGGVKVSRCAEIWLGREVLVRAR